MFRQRNLILILSSLALVLAIAVWFLGGSKILNQKSTTVVLPDTNATISGEVKQTVLFR